MKEPWHANYIVKSLNNRVSVCNIPMGLFNPAIVADNQIHASSVLDQYHGPERGRIFTQTDGPYGGAWRPR